MSLIFTEQLSTSDGNTMLTFFDLTVYQNSPQVRREPAWFNWLQTLLTVDITSRELRQKTPHIKNYYFDFSSSNFLKQVPTWRMLCMSYLLQAQVIKPYLHSVPGVFITILVPKYHHRQKI
ncbi:13189_t:CDS:2, partial [Funneliformis geosporum]